MRGGFLGVKHLTGADVIAAAVTRVLLHMKSAFCPAASALVVLALAGCSGSMAPPASTSLSSPPAAARKTPAAKTEREATRCDDRKNASGDIYVRMKTRGTATVAQELGGEWRWDYSTGKCLTSVQLMIATAPQVPGSCTWVGYVADNRGYHVNATPARPLRNVAASSGSAC